MAISRKRNSPGIEINEIDRSQYNNKPDYSVVDTTTLMCGFADKGNDYNTEWINSLDTLENTYGTPTNEVERYFYNGIVEILSKGGIALAAKLPYVNDSKDKYAQVSWKIDTELSNDTSEILNDLLSVDSSLTSYIQISSNAANYDKLIDLSTLDDYRTSKKLMENDTITIVDITRKQYEKISMVESISSTNKIFEKNEEFLGILPVIVTPVNAMYYQQLITDTTDITMPPEESSNINEQFDTDTDTDTDTSDIGKEYSSKLRNYTVIVDAYNRGKKDLSVYTEKDLVSQNFDIPLSSASINDQTVSKVAANLFPTLTYTSVNTLERKYLKQIGVVVFQVYANNGDRKRLSFSPVESFIGSLDKNEKDSITKGSIYIGDIINSNSQFINFFSNVRTTSDAYKNASTIFIQNQVGCILGFLEDECKKHISYNESIIEPLNKIFNQLQDPNYIDIDIVCDAGVSNIGQYIYNYGGNKIDIAYYPFKKEDNEPNWTLNKYSDTYAWKAIISKYNDFCKNTRKDCMFIADVLRPFCLEGNQKLLRPTNLANTIENTIIPNLRYITIPSSSFAAGYCDWFYIKDYYSGDFFWLPPSIKAAGIYTYVDTYYHKWDAPAGMIKGKLNGVYDVAFSPKNDEAGKIYKAGWNYAISYPIDGIILEGQKTFQIEETALDRVNVRRLMLYLEKQTRRIARYFVYEGNTAYIRQKFVDTLRPIFEDAKNGYGLRDYIIRCDDTNNTVQDIENNQLRCAIAIKPVKTIEWIIVNYIITNQSASVSEEVLKD